MPSTTSSTASKKKSKNTASLQQQNALDNYESWTAQQFASYLQEKHNLPQYYEVVIQHDITGKVAPQLTEENLKEMGITSIGDRKRFQLAIQEMQKVDRKRQREIVIWEGDEELYASWWQEFCQTCCGCCPQDASHYKLTGTHLSIKLVDTKRCGPIRCCCGHEYHIDNVDLTHVTDADVRGVAPPLCQKICCCGKTRDFIRIKTSGDGKKVLVLKKGEGEPTSRVIMNQVEEAQQMERD